MFPPRLMQDSEAGAWVRTSNMAYRRSTFFPKTAYVLLELSKVDLAELVWLLAAEHVDSTDAEILHDDAELVSALESLKNVLEEVLLPIEV